MQAKGRWLAVMVGLSALGGRGALALTTCLDSVTPSMACVYQTTLKRECCVVGFPNNTKRLCSTEQWNGFSGAYWKARSGCEEAIDTCEPFTKSCP